MGFLGTTGSQRTPGWVRWTVLAALLLAVVGSGLVAAQRVSTSRAPSGSEVRAAAAAPEVDGPVVSLTFNTGSPDQYRYARPLLRRHGVNATFYVAPGRVDRDEACCMTWKQLRQLYSEGDEIGGTGLDGVNLTTRHSGREAEDLAYKRQQVCDGYRLLAEHGLDPRSFAYPGGAHRYDFPSGHRSLADLVAECGYESGRILGGLSEQGSEASVALPPDDPYVLATPPENGRAALVLADLQRPVLAAAEGGGRWVPLAFDAVCHRGDPGFDACRGSRRPVDDAVLDAFLGWLRDAGRPGGAPAGTRVETVRQVLGAPPQPPLPPARTLVSLTFDDGDRTQVTAAELMRSRGLPGTFFVNSGPVDAGNPYVMAWHQLRVLQAQGNEIGGHTRDHVTLTDPTLTDAQKREEVCGDRERLREAGLEVVSFAYPQGGLDQEAKELVRSCGYTSARSAGGVSPREAPYAETVPPADPYATLAVDGPEAPAGEGRASEPLTLAALRGAVVTANERGGGWVQFVLHRVCSRGRADFGTCMRGEGALDDRTFTGFLDWLVDGAPAGTEVVTVRQAVSGDP
jgi:peptidoglycan/xylan/chitin deacetylase (PgdA/CDA1 family)